MSGGEAGGAIALADGLYLLEGAVNTGVLVAGGKALLFDCCDSVSPERLRALGVEWVEAILCTQHRRPNTAGCYPYVAQGAQLTVPAGERQLFEGVDAYWSDWRNRWHIYHHQPGPQVLTQPLTVARGVSDGEVVEWKGHRIRVLETPGATGGSVSYLLEAGGTAICFSGDAIYGPGQVWDLYSLQKGFGGIDDYHGFLGNRRVLAASLEKLGASGADVLVPSHGAPMRDPRAATDLLIRRLEAVWRNYASVSALNYYFPGLLAPNPPVEGGPRGVTATTRELPPFVRRVGHTSSAIISESGAAFLVDCGHDSVVETLQQWLAQGLIASVEGCWVTHYHDDHVDALQRLAQAFACPIIADRGMADIVRHPQRYFLPCISPNAAPVARTTRDGETWSWREYTLTAYHFPGQTLYHGGLLVEGHGERVFFCGDSFAPTGLDDYCAGNRNWLGPGVGLRRCLDVLRFAQPDCILNQHQEKAFIYTGRELEALEAALAERERLLAEMVPWPHPDFATDEHWVRTYPFEQEAWRGGRVAVEVQFTNHGREPTEAEAEPVLPEGWRWEKERGATRMRVEAAGGGRRPEGVVRVWLEVPGDAPAGRHVLPFRVTWGEHYLGQFRHAVVHVLR